MGKRLSRGNEEDDWRQEALSIGDKLFPIPISDDELQLQEVIMSDCYQNRTESSQNKRITRSSTSERSTKQKTNSAAPSLDQNPIGSTKTRRTSLRKASSTSSVHQNTYGSSQNEKIPAEKLKSPISFRHQNPTWSSKTVRTPIKKSKTVTFETGGSSGLYCEICMEEKQTVEMFHNKNCSHVFCSKCISKHITTKIQEKITTVKCPDVKCEGVLEAEFCQSIIPSSVFERWVNALCESMFLVSQRFYCPFKDCSTFLVDDGGEVIAQSECPSCHRLFCARCKVAWHSGFGCEEFQRLGRDERGRDDLMVIELAKNSKWKRCPECRFYVEKVQGCLHITCRCGFEFCYGCGSTWTTAHTVCHT